jgi:hypothetical protein
MRYLLGILALGLLVVGCESTPKKKGAAEQKPTAKQEKAAPAPAKVESVQGEIECSHGKDVRKLAIGPAANGGCEVLYTKQGATSTVATANRGSSHCETVLNKIKNNLVSSGYSCK